MTVLSSYPHESIILRGEEHAVWLEAHPNGWWMCCPAAGIEAWGLGPREAERAFEAKRKEARA